MRLPILRIILLAAAVEAAAVGLLAAVVAISGPSDPKDAQAFAERFVQFIGPIASALLCFCAAWWLARRTRRGRQRPVLCGLLLGAVCSAIDLALLAALGGKFGWIIAVSNTGRLLAGALGGLIARWTEWDEV
jgi:H+/gluconate symporter-like permease